MTDILTGKLLIADPFLKDPNFLRTVVFICEHNSEGSFGFVLNKKHDLNLGELVVGLEASDFPVYVGGPVQIDTIHFVHQCPDLIPGGVSLTDGIFWGGEFEAVLRLIKEDKLTTYDIRFFIGYSGWSEGQLEEEMKERSWITGDGTRKLIFPTNVANTWKDALKQLGGEYGQMVNYPLDPQLN
ncbi:MAG TPA: YqgE/AlgH family protein [Segetibacter sp.]|jgi:putative transcriptional regulator